jgi:hypothetical protein
MCGLLVAVLKVNGAINDLNVSKCFAPDPANIFFEHIQENRALKVYVAKNNNKTAKNVVFLFSFPSFL